MVSSKSALSGLSRSSFPDTRFASVGRPCSAGQGRGCCRVGQVRRKPKELPQTATLGRPRRLVHEEMPQSIGRLTVVGLEAEGFAVAGQRFVVFALRVVGQGQLEVHLGQFGHEPGLLVPLDQGVL